MRLKNPLNFGLWDFYIGEDNSQLLNLRIPSHGYASSKRSLVNQVIATFDSFASQGKPEYKIAAVEESIMMKIDYYTYIGKIIEHQLCLRHGGVNGGKCYPSGIGDKLHSLAYKVDSVVDKSPKIVQKFFGKLVGLITNQNQETGASILDNAPPIPQKNATAKTGGVNIHRTQSDDGSRPKGEKLVKKTQVIDGQLVREQTRPRLGGCSSCGGRRAFSHKGKNMGRAGRLQ